MDYHYTFYVGLPTNQVSRNNKHTVCWNGRLINDEFGYNTLTRYDDYLVHT